MFWSCAYGILGTRLSGPRPLGKVVFLQDDRLLDSYAQWALSWWRGERASRGVIGDLTRRCRYVSYGPGMGKGLSGCYVLRFRLGYVGLGMGVSGYLTRISIGRSGRPRSSDEIVIFVTMLPSLGYWGVGFRDVLGRYSLHDQSISVRMTMLACPRCVLVVRYTLPNLPCVLFPPRAGSTYADCFTISFWWPRTPQGFDYCRVRAERIREAERLFRC